MNTSTLYPSKTLRWAGLIVALSFLAIGCIGLSTSSAIASQDKPAVFESPATTRSFADVVEMVSPSVVAISVNKKVAARPTAGLQQRFPGGQGSPFDEFFGQYFGRQGRQMPERAVQALGSGFVVDQSGYIVTNNHVIEDAGSITIVMQDGREFDATLVGTDPKTDLALLKIEADVDLPALTLGNSDAARVGDWVLAIGNPFGLGGSATAGIISARGRDLRSGPYDDYLQIDAPINSGNSGGPVFNANGEVIGVNTAIYSPNGGNVGIGFAIPSKQVQTIIAELKDTGTVRRGWLGVQIQDIDKDLASSLGLDHDNGALVADVVADSPAAEAGFQVGDVIMDFDGNEITTAKSLSLAVANADAATKVPVKILRDGKSKTLRVKLGEAEQVADNQDNGHMSQGTVGEELGLALSNLTDNEREQLGLPDDYSGVLVSQVDPNGSAAKQGVRPGDVIARVGSASVHNVNEAKAAIAKAKSAGDYTALLVRRRDGQQFVSVAFS